MADTRLSPRFMWYSSSSSHGSPLFHGDDMITPSPLSFENRVHAVVPFAWEERPGVPLCCSPSAHGVKNANCNQHKVHIPSASAYPIYQRHSHEQNLMLPLPLPPARSPAHATAPQTPSRVSARRRAQIGIKVTHDPFLLAMKACSKSENTRFHQGNNDLKEDFHQDVDDHCSERQLKGVRFSPRLPLLSELLQEEAEEVSSNPTSKTRVSPKLAFVKKFPVTTNNNNVHSLYGKMPLLSKLFENHNSTITSQNNTKPSTIKPNSSLHSQHLTNTNTSIELNSIFNEKARKIHGTNVSLGGNSCMGCSALEHLNSIIQIP